MIFRYIGGSNIYQAIKSGQNILFKNKIPIYNYAVENSGNKKMVYNEHVQLINNLQYKSKIAIKLSAFEFDISLLNKLIELSKKKKYK